MEAVSIYLRLLRNDMGLSREKAAARAGISSKTLERWEGADTENEPGITKLKQLVRALGGSAKDAAELLIRDDAKEEEGRQAAIAWLALSPEERKRVDSVLDSAILPEELIEIIEELRADYDNDKSLAAFLKGVLLSGRARDTRQQ